MAEFLILLLIIISYICGSLFSNYITGGYTVTQKTLYTKYPKYRINKKITFDEFCYPTSFTLQKQQSFAGEFMSPKNKHSSLLVFHKIGAGKTCLSIQIAEQWISRGKPLMLMPASLIPGFRNELRSKCAKDNYISAANRQLIKTLHPTDNDYKQIIHMSDELINSKYTIMSYNEFAMKYKKIDAPLCVIDEVQNINNPNGTYYKIIMQWIESHPKSTIVIMSGTPLFDNPSEIYGLANMLRIKYQNKITPRDIPKLFNDKISYYNGAPSYTFPTVYLKVKKCYMSKHQAHWYKSQVEAESKNNKIVLKDINNNFYIKTRQRSNIVYPNGLNSETGLAQLTYNIILNKLQVYSCKLAVLIKKILKNQLSFIYTGFTGVAGIAVIVKCLEANGFKDYFKHGPGKHRFAVWSGDQTLNQKDNIRSIFNNKQNDNCSQLQVVIGSPAIKEGVSLLRVRQVHVLETYWNHSRLEQIYGRAVRYCSHKTLPKQDRDVTIYLYAACVSRNKSIDPNNSIDLYMLNIADKKREQTTPYIDAMINTAVDRMLYYKK